MDRYFEIIILNWDGIRALLLRRNSDWCGNWCGRLSRRAAIEEQRLEKWVDVAVFYCGAPLLRSAAIEERRNRRAHFFSIEALRTRGGAPQFERFYTVPPQLDLASTSMLQDFEKERKRSSVCVCVCVCVRERERKGNKR